MRFMKLTTALATGLVLIAVAGCASNTRASEKEAQTTATDLVSSLNNGTSPELRFKPESAKLLTVHNGITFVTADPADNKATDLCLLPFSKDGADLGGVCADSSPVMISTHGTDYAYGEKPSAEFGNNWSELAPDFWTAG